MSEEAEVQVFAAAACKTLTRPGRRSVQLLSPHNAPEAAVTITKVTMQPGSPEQRHSHPGAEQIWIVEEGTAFLLLAGNRSRPIGAGDIVRTPPGAVHGIHNTGSVPFVYIAVTTPPVDFSAAYESTSNSS
jgi:mannose-6-phosphate isomerase-like protein (cupin superfamily)